MDKEKREVNLPVLILSIFGGGVLIFLISFIYLSLNGEIYNSIYTTKIEAGEIMSPIKQFQLSLVDEELEIPANSKIITFDTDEGKKRIIISADLQNISLNDIQKEMVNYLSVILKLYNLHKIPFTSIKPQVQVYVDNSSYFAEIIEGDILIKEGKTSKPDITLRTTNEEIFRIIEDNGYAKESIESGRSSFELTSNYFILFAKGYYRLYKDFQEWSFTGNIIFLR